MHTLVENATGELIVDADSEIH